MAQKLRNLVSKSKRRYKDGEYDLDLSYIGKNIIAMGYPADNFEGVYRNNIGDVSKFLEDRHKGHYKIYNLCSERSYDVTRFNCTVVNFPFDDHNPPRIDIIRPFCQDVQEWLRSDSENVAVIHCKAGKGRTGVMICAYLLHERKYETAEEALEYYGQERTKNEKGVTIPSQRRYVGYYATLLAQNLEYKPTTLLLTKICLETVPNFSTGNISCSALFVVNQQKVKLYTSNIENGRKGDRNIIFNIPQSLPVCGDIKVEFFHKPNIILKQEKMYHFWLNTFFISKHHISDNPCISNGENNVEGEKDITVCLCKDELDKANKDKTNTKFSPNFKVSCVFTRVENSMVVVPVTSEHSPAPSMAGPCSGVCNDDTEEDLSDTDTDNDDMDGLESASV